MNDQGARLAIEVMGDRDPGYGSTSKIISETAMLLLETPDIAPGVWTLGAALGCQLMDRLSEKAGLTFSVNDLKRCAGPGR